MKNIKKISCSALTLLAAATLCENAYASTMHTDVALQTYTNFGQNKGRYETNANALLKHIRERDGGIVISYTDNTAPWKISNTQGMINFSATDDIGAQVVIGANIMATVHHNGSINASFGHREIGADHAVNYSAIDIRGSEVFRLFPKNTNGGAYDYMLQRQSKIVTDATWNPLTQETNMALLKGKHIYHSGSGAMNLWNESSKSKTAMLGAYQYIVGGINEAVNTQTHAGTTNISIHQNPNFGNGVGASTKNPLPNAIQGGDSGSPIFFYNDSTKRYEYLAAQQSGGGNSYGQARGNVAWSHEIMESFNVRPDMKGINEVRLTAVSYSGENKKDAAGRSTRIYYGKATTASGNVLGEYNGVRSGQYTWKNLADVKDRQNWYAYDSEKYLQQKDEDLFFNENLVFTATQENNNIILEDTVDLGIGYVEFNRGNLQNAVYNIKSEGSESNLLNSAGYVVNEGAIVHLYQTNPSNHMLEWRKTGAGDLHIRGNGNSNALLSVGGSGKTFLQRDNGYAAYNVLVSGGATVVIKDTKQIARDLTFGNGGGTLDMNGNSMTWKLSNTNVPADGFSINALTEDAFIANGKGAATLTFSETGSQTFLGSFRDTANSSLKIIYDGGTNSSWTLHSTFTHLQNAGSGLDVRSGNVKLAGTNTVHGLGSASGKNTQRYSHADDWHYADAKMNVMVGGGATFTLGSHARLTGNVEVMRYGVLVMNEGVKHRKEYIEGGLALEDTYAISDFYGLKGNVHLYQGSEMRVAYSAGTTANTTYAGNISGNGKISVNGTGSTGTFTLAGDNSKFTGALVLNAGTLVLGSPTAGHSGTTFVHGGTLEFSGNVKTTGNVEFHGNGGSLKFKTAGGNGKTVHEVGVISTNASDNYARNISVEKNVTVNAKALVNAWGLKTLHVDGVLNLSDRLEFATGRNASMENNKITGSGTIKTNRVIFENIGTYNIGYVRLEIGSGGMSGNGAALNLGNATIVASENWDSPSNTGINLVSFSGTVFETESASGKATHAALAGGISGSGNLIKKGAGTLSIFRNNLYFTGQIIVEEGTLLLEGSTANLGARDETGAGSRYAAVIKKGGTLDINGRLKTGDNCYKMELAGGALVNNGGDVGSDDRQITGLKLSADSEIGGSGNFGLIGSGYCGVTLDLAGKKLTKTGANTFYLANATVTSGTLQINEGSLEIAESDSNASAADLVIAGGNLKLSGENDFSVKSVSGNSGSIEIGSGILSVGANNVAVRTYSGSVNFSGAGKISFVAGTHDWSGIKISPENSANGLFEISGNGTRVKMSAHGKQSISVGENATLETRAVSSNDAVDMSGVTGNGKVALKLRDGNGRGFNLSAFTGTIEVGKDSGVSVGRLRLNTSTLNSQAKISVISGGELAFDGTGTKIENDIVFEANSKIHANHLKDGVISGKLSSASGVVLTKAGNGVLTLSGDNSGFAGKIVVATGTLVVTDVRALGSGDVHVNKGGIIRLSAESVDGFSGVTLASGAKFIISEKLLDSLVAVKTGSDEQTEVDLETLKTTIKDGNVELAASEQIKIVRKSGASLLTESADEPVLFSAAPRMANFAFLRVENPVAAACPTCITAVPEPSAFALLSGLGVLALVASRRRRK